MDISPAIIVMTEIMIITNFLFSMINLDEYDVSTNRFGYVARERPKPLRILFDDTKGVQWTDTDSTSWLTLIEISLC